MKHKFLHMFVIVSLLLTVLVSPQVALAQKPEPPDQNMKLESPPVIENMSAPAREIAQKAATLQESLTAEQKTAIREILDKYQPETQAILALLSNVPKSDSDAPPQPTNLDKSIAERMATLTNDIESEIATVLNAEQQALHQAALDIGPETTAQPNEAATLGTPAGVAGGYGCTEYCLYAPTYESYAEYFGFYGYYYAYYSYQYTGSSYAYDAMVDAFEGLNDSHMALKYSAPIYYECSVGVPLTWSYNDTPNTAWAWYYTDDAEYYTYYAYQSAYYDYIYYGNTYAYNSYVYNYYSYIYADYANYYAYYCYAYW